MARLCERPGCSTPASVTYGFEAARAVVWLAAFAEDADRRDLVGVLCRRHADALTAPRGWWVDDRRIAVPTLFNVPQDPPPGPEPAPAAPVAEPETVGIGEAEPERVARAPRRRRKVSDDTEELPFDFGTARAISEPPAHEPEPPSHEPPADRPSLPEPHPVPRSHHVTPDPDETLAMPWTPVFDRSDDLGGLLKARSPLLSRAFGLEQPPT